MEKFIKLTEVFETSSEEREVFVNLGSIVAFEINNSKVTVMTMLKCKDKKFYAYSVKESMTEIEEKLKKINAI